MKTPDHPAASSLPPSDGGGADWAEQLADALRDLILADDVYWNLTARQKTVAIIRKHAPTQQPEEQPEAGGRPFWDSEMRRKYTWAHTSHIVEMGELNSVFIELDRLRAALSLHPESPDAQRGELRGLLERVLSMPDLFVGAFPSQLNRSVAVERILSGLSALPAKGPGPRRLDPDLAMKVRLCANDAQGKELIAHAFAPPPASHSKQSGATAMSTKRPHVRKGWTCPKCGAWFGWYRHSVGHLKLHENEPQKAQKEIQKTRGLGQVAQASKTQNKS